MRYILQFADSNSGLLCVCISLGFPFREGDTHGLPEGLHSHFKLLQAINWDSLHPILRQI